MRQTFKCSKLHKFLNYKMINAAEVSQNLVKSDILVKKTYKKHEIYQKCKKKNGLNVRKFL